MVSFSERLLDRLRHTESVVALTGAGISASSGVPTFRGKDGLWNKFRPEELANLHAFLKNPELVWEWYSWRRELIRNVKPNLGHYALVDIESYFSEFTLVTQNVDNLHQVAGNKRIIELHGNIMRNKCVDCNYQVASQELEAGIVAEEKKIPTCPQCGSLIRPDVVWFGEMLPEEAITRAQEAASAAEVFFSIGTSSTVEPAASLPYLAKGNGAYLVEINPDETPLSSVTNERFAAGADEVLPALAIEIEKMRSRYR